MRLKNKVAIVTGGASGIGAATCRLYAQEGAAGIVVADINEEAGQSVAGEIVQAGGEAIFVHLDVSVESQWIDTVNATVERYNRLDITVNNAGMSVAESRVKVEDTTVEIWDRLHAVNSTGVFLGTKHSISPMRENGSGSIINISSVSGYVAGSRRHPAHAATKAGIAGLTKQIAVEYGPMGIRCNAIAPGFLVYSEGQRRVAGQSGSGPSVEGIPMGRHVTPTDTAMCALYLASDESAMVNGQTLVLDGGRSVA